MSDDQQILFYEDHMATCGTDALNFLTSPAFLTEAPSLHTTPATVTSEWRDGVPTVKPSSQGRTEIPPGYIIVPI